LLSNKNFQKNENRPLKSLCILSLFIGCNVVTEEDTAVKSNIQNYKPSKSLNKGNGMLSF
jgi:hypothetical protein